LSNLWYISIYMVDASVLITIIISFSDGSSFTSLASNAYYKDFKINL
jgi:hypothetical protein